MQRSIRFAFLAAAAALTAASLASAQGDFTFTIDTPASAWSWTATTSLGPLVGDPNSNFSLAGTVSLDLDGGANPIATGQIIGANAATIPAVMAAHIPNPIPIFPNLADVELQNLVFTLSTPAFTVNPNGTFATDVLLTVSSGSLFVDALGGSPTTNDLAGSAGDPTPITGTIDMVGNQIRIESFQSNTFMFMDASSGITATLTLTGDLDGTFDCPAPASACATASNSAGAGATIAYNGSTSVSTNNGSLEANGLPANVFGVFYFGGNSIQLPFGDGFRCVGGQTFRLPLASANAGGQMTTALDFTSGNGANIGVGDRLFFQCWFRDPSGPGGSGFNLSDSGGGLLLPLRSLAALAVGLLACGLLAGRQARDRETVVLVPFVVDEARVLQPVDVQVAVVNASVGEVRLERLRVSHEGVTLVDEPLTRALPADPEYAAVQALLERLPDEVTHLHRDRAFAAPDEPSIPLRDVVERTREARARVALMQARYAAGVGEPFIQPTFTLALEELFTPAEPAGARAELALAVDYRAADGVLRTARTRAEITWAGPWPSAPLAATSLAALSVHAGDLHVHSCHGEAVGACAPSGDCPAESFQTSGSFSYAQLKGQFQALGLDWFTATDHSYCIDSDAEYQTIASECAALTDASFLCLPDIELSSDEEGPQIGSDLGDVVCLGTTEANHMGAHGLSARIPGGDDAFLGFCDGLFTNALAGFQANVAAVRAQGGYPIVHHPEGSSFGWNSFQATAGQESGALHGVEIWNGAAQTGQGGNVGRWVDWMLAGRILYAYSGSDTHDAAFAFGANHVLVEGTFDASSLDAALRAGRLYVSDGPALVLETEIGGASLLMGTVQPLPTGAPAAPVVVNAHYDFGASTGTLTIFRGRAGDPAETVLAQSGPLTGAGTFTFTENLAPNAQSWFRAYAETQAGDQAAYTNPVFFVPGTGDVFAYCAPKVNSLGCPTGIGASGTPSASAGSGFLVAASDVLSQKFGLLFYGFAPAFLPFQDGTRCVGGGIRRTPIQHSGGNAAPDCSGAFSLDFNERIASGVDPALVSGATVYAQYWYRDGGAAFPTGLTDALQFTIGP